MKKFALALAAASIALPALAAEPITPAATPAAKEAPAAAMMAPAAGAPKPMELKNGQWVKVDEKGMAFVSKDGKTWGAAPDGIHEMKDGSKVETKAGAVMKK